MKNKGDNLFIYVGSTRGKLTVIVSWSMTFFSEETTEK